MSESWSYRAGLVLHGSDEGCGFDGAWAHRLCASLPEHAGHGGLVRKTELTFILLRRQYIETSETQVTLVVVQILQRKHQYM